MTALQELTAKIHKHCPELLELNFGCETNHGIYLSDQKVFAGNELGRFIDPETLETSSILGSYTDGEDGERRLETLEDLVKSGELEILGHPITLEHVLKAIGKGSSDYTIKDMQVAHRGEVLDISVWGKSEADQQKIRPFMDWQLGKPLSEQSPELIEWLNQIIV